MPRGKRDLSNHEDKGSMYWVDYVEELRATNKSRLSLLMAKTFDPAMATSEGLVRTETWKIGSTDDAKSYQAQVKFDTSFLVWVFTERYKELGWIEGATIHLGRMQTLTDKIQEHHAKEKEREVEKELLIAAQHLVRAGVYSDVDLALEFIKSSQRSESNGKAKAKAKEPSMA